MAIVAGLLADIMCCYSNREMLTIKSTNPRVWNYINKLSKAHLTAFI